MATLTLRIDDDLRDALQAKARDQSTTVSDLIRDLIVESLVPVRESTEGAPQSMTLHDRQVFAMLHRILARVLPDDANDVDGDREYQLERARVLELGYTNEYADEFSGLHPELSRRDGGRVMDILDMFRMIDGSVREIRAAGGEVTSDLIADLRFEGFDFNDEVEGQMAGYVRHLLAQGKWKERRPDIERTDDGNSHAPMLDVYLRMLAEYRRIVDARPPASRWSTHLTLNDLQRIAHAQAHSSNRPRRGV